MEVREKLISFPRIFFYAATPVADFMEVYRYKSMVVYNSREKNRTTYREV